MDPRLRNALIGLISSGLAVWVGVAIAQEERFIASVSAGICLWAVLAWTRGPRAESWLLAFLFFGYVIGNRGFAQLAPVGGIPLFFSELGLAIALALVFLRGALARVLPFHRDPLNVLLLFWLALGSGRMLWDLRHSGIMALRDFATVYYVLYFFTIQALARHQESRGLLHRSILLTFGLLPFTALLSYLFPEFFLTNFLIDHVPLIFYKGDLLATFLFTGYVVLLPTTGFESTTRNGWRWLLAIGSAAGGLALLSRASLLGLLVAMVWLARAGRWRPLGVFISICLTGLVGITAVSLVQNRNFTQTRVYAIYESVASIADFSGTRDYRSEDSSNKGDNNQFRLVWWKNVAEETLTTSPLLGLGFGTDLARGFVQEYYPDSTDEFSARSPHNLFMTVLGRMGLLGFVVLICIYWTLARGTARLACEARQDPGRHNALTLHAALWVILISACFGVVLEGPMGAIPFWIMLGLAHHDATVARGTPASPSPAA